MLQCGLTDNRISVLATCRATIFGATIPSLSSIRIQVGMNCMTVSSSLSSWKHCQISWQPNHAMSRRIYSPKVQQCKKSFGRRSEWVRKRNGSFISVIVDLHRLKRPGPSCRTTDDLIMCQTICHRSAQVGFWYRSSIKWHRNPPQPPAFRQWSSWMYVIWSL